MTRVHTERVRELLAAATPGPWDAGSVSVYATAGCPRHAPDGDPTDVRRCACRIVVADPMDRDRPLIAAAPDLARTVVSLADDVARLTADLAASRQAHATLAAAQRAYVQHGEFACDDVRTEAREAVVALLSDAPAPSMVPAAVVREYLTAAERYEGAADDLVEGCIAETDLGIKRAALEAALARCP